MLPGRHPGRPVHYPSELVTREELRKTLARRHIRRFLERTNKSHQQICGALGDSAENPRFVETVARCGYPFLAEFKIADAATVRSPERLPRRGS
jgi:DNA-binding winged helix-turn-helix (wHTH) protein